MENIIIDETPCFTETKDMDDMEFEKSIKDSDELMEVIHHRTFLRNLTKKRPCHFCSFI